MVKTYDLIWEFPDSVMADEWEEEAAHWSDWEGEDEQVQCLFSQHICSNMAEVVTRAKTNFGFDVQAECSRLGFLANDTGAGYIGCVRLVNFLRRQYKDGFSAKDSLELLNKPAVIVEKDQAIKGDNCPLPPSLHADVLLRPQIENDPLLHSLHEYLQAAAESVAVKDATSKDNTHDLKEQVGISAQVQTQLRELEAENALLKEELARVKQAAQRHLMGTTNKSTPAPSNSVPDINNNALRGMSIAGEEGDRQDGAYFAGYAHYSIHEQMLKDKARTMTYRAWLSGQTEGAALLAESTPDTVIDTNSVVSAKILNSKYLEGKVVIDIGCGSGILSLFAAKAGARRVIAIDNSSVVHVARQVVLQ